jgi:hypothetical protein
VFGRLWKYSVRDKHLLTPDDYKEAVIKACTTQNTPAEVVDIFVVPDYTSFFEGCGDKNLGNYSKKEATQLQFVFQAVPQSDLFPLGVKTVYKAYSADEVVEIVKTKKSEELDSGDDDDELQVRVHNYYVILPSNYKRVGQ